MNDHLKAIGQLLRTQDNRYTAEPFFLVQEKRRIYGLDDQYTDQSAWLNVDGDEVTDEKEIETLEDNERWDRPNIDHYKVYYLDQWQYVTGCFTEQACKDYIARNGHRHQGELRIYADSLYRNHEMLAVRAFLMAQPTP